MAFNYRPGDEPVPGYRLERFLGRGAIGEVWQATGPGGTEAALKIIDLTGSAAHARKECRALQLVKRIHHPNLVPIIAFWAKGEDGSLLEESVSAQIASALGPTSVQSMQQTLVAPLEAAGPRPKELIIAMGLGHKSLADRLSECQQQGLEGIPLEELLGYMEDAAKAIDFLNSPVHELESGVGAIGHCDIKPLNLLIVGGAVQVCDFGLAHIVGAARTTAAAMGTIAYVAPELLEGKPSPATDQYCLAVSYYELRTGALPYDQETSGAVMKAVLDGALNFSRVPEAEQAVLRKATARDPADRYRSASEMVAALREAALGGMPPPARHAPLLAVLNVLVAVLVLAVVAGVVWLGVSRAGRERIAQPGGEPGPGSQPGLMPPGPPEDTAAKLASLVQQAAESAAKGDWQSAAQGYDAVLAVEPAHRLALLGRADCALRLRNYDEALQLLRRVEPPDPATLRSFAQQFIQLGQELVQKQSWEPARDAFRRALELDPQNPTCSVWIGRACLEMDLADDALLHFNQAIQLDPANADAHFFRGRAWLKKQQYDQAIADFERLMHQIDPDNRLGYASRKDYGEAYLGRGTAIRDEAKRLLIEAEAANDEEKRQAARAKLQQAVAEFTKAIQYDDKNPLVLSRRGTSQLQLGNLDEAVADLTQAIQYGNQDVDRDLVYRGSVYQKLAIRAKSDPVAKAAFVQKARDDFANAAKANPRNADAEYLLAEACTMQDDYRSAIEAYSRFLDKYKGWPECWFSPKGAYYYRGHCYMLDGGLKEAAEDFAQTLGLPGDLPDEPGRIARVLHELATEFAKRKQLDQAHQWNQKAIGLAPDQATKQQYSAAAGQWGT
ncbi:MAG: tetratricopeptide repeat protein [Thermoguttaceae bacterium]